MKKRVLLKDIAKELGVSTALVSYVLNGKEKEARVGEEMVQKIREHARKMNYQPNLLARSLKFGRTNTLGLIVADISNPFFAMLARIIENVAGGLGYTVIIGSSDENTEKAENLVETFLGRQVDGLIITPVEGMENKIHELKTRQIPHVLIDRAFTAEDEDAVLTDNAEVSRKAVDLLIKNGYSKIGMIGYKTGLMHMEDRISGYKKALKENGLKINARLVKRVPYENTEEIVAKNIRDFLGNGKPKVDALFFATNSISLSALKEIIRLGIRVPEDLGIVCFDESEAYDFFYSPITYVKQDMQGIGENAVQRIVQMVEKKDGKEIAQTIPASIVIRQSSGGLLVEK